MSSAERRIRAHLPAQDKVSDASFLEYHNRLLDRCKLQNYDKRGGAQLDELELLADLQHYGAATCLLDFTRNALVALWFACKTNGKADGKVFVTNIDDGETFLEITSRDIKDKPIRDILEFKTRENSDEANGKTSTRASGSSQTKPKFWYWTPAHLNERVTAQHSLFLFGPPSSGKPASKEFVVPSSHKECIRRELKELHNISEESLFPDFVGFADTQRQDAFYDVADAKKSLRRAADAIRQGQYSKAIEWYGRCIELEPAVREPYFLRGNAKAMKQDYAGAKRDYDLAVDRSDRPSLDSGTDFVPVNDPDLFQIRFNRVNAKAELSDYEDALEDYDAAVERSPTCGPAFFNRANVKAIVYRFEEALEDYEKAIRFGALGAHFNKGNVLVKLGRFDEALQCYDKCLQEGDRGSGASANREAVKDILEKVEGRNSETTPANLGGSSEVRVHISGSHQEQAFPFRGNIGNTGNFGGNGLPSGKGFPGQAGFTVRLVRAKS